ncbi:MAG TPA: winged helix-turn-helix domain-containing protein [Thermomicrobiales bacterium]|nr:winged helix-turn-helix domain-containing protein [Thermomicrobiales bacterium]
MGKKTDKAIAKLRSDVQALSEAVWALKEHVRVEAAAESAAAGSRKRTSRKLRQIETQLADGEAQGRVSGYGSVRLPGANGVSRVVRWQLENVTTDSVLPIDLEPAAAVLSAVGHRQRLSILIALLRQPMSVSELVSSLDLGTSGAAYHHLNVLQNVDLVAQQERGIFELAPQQVATVIGMLSALAVSPTVETEESVPGQEPDGGADSAE